MRIIPRALCCVVLVLAGPVYSEQPTIPQLVQTHLEIDLSIHYDSATLSGEAMLTLKNVGESPIDTIPLQLGRLLHVEKVVGRDGQPMHFEQDVVIYDDWPQFQVNQVWVTLTSAIQAGESQSFTIHYSGTLVGYTETGMLYVRDHVDSSFTIIRSDARAFPIVAVPSISALRAQPRGDFGFAARITVPAGFTVATGVPASEQIKQGDVVTWVFKSSQPVPFLNIAVAPYAVLDGAGARVYYFPEDSSGARRVMNAIDGALRLYAGWFGSLEGASRLQVIEIPQGWGSQASLTGGIIQTASTFREAGRLTEVYHELSHLWNVSDLDLPSCRWNEGLAMFLQQRVAVEMDQAEDLDSYMARTADFYRATLKEESSLAIVPFIDYGKKGMTDYSYTTGQLMFYVLYRVMGEAQFDSAMKGFVTTHRASGSTTAEFADALRKGNPAVAQVLSDWLFTARWAQRLNTGEALDAMISGYLHK